MLGRRKEVEKRIQWRKEGGGVGEGLVKVFYLSAVSTQFVIRTRRSFEHHLSNQLD